MYNETYDDYIRSILGYPPMMPYKDNFTDCRNQNMMNSNMNINSMNTTSNMDLESCYPEIYKIVYPMVQKKCDSVGTSVSNDDIQNMTNEIYFALEGRAEVQLNINLGNEVRKSETTNSNMTKISEKQPSVKISETSSEKRETRQINTGLRDLIQILLIRELLRRRRPGERPGRPPMPRPPMPGPRPPMRPPFRPGFGPGGPMFNRDFEISNYDIYEN